LSELRDALLKALPLLGDVAIEDAEMAEAAE